MWKAIDEVFCSGAETHVVDIGAREGWVAYLCEWSCVCLWRVCVRVVGLSDSGGGGWKLEGVTRSLVRPECLPVSISSIFSYAGCMDREKMKEARMSP